MTGTHLIPTDGSTGRADKVLATAYPAHSRTAWQRAFDAGLVSMDGEPIARKQTVGPGDEIEFAFPAVKAANMRPVAIPLDVLFEDEHFVAISKAAGMVVHPGAGTAEDTLVHALLAHCAGGLSGIGGVERPGIVHRLDRETSGVMVAAKTDAAHRALAMQFAERTLEKSYLALVDGVPRLLSGSVRAPIGRNLAQRHKMAVVEGPAGRDAHTDWEVKERFGLPAALVACHIHTGRTHQIRVHMKHLGHILLGDLVYGWKAREDLPVPRVMLHAARLALTHPHSGEPLVIEAPLPADYEAVLARLRQAG